MTNKHYNIAILPGDGIGQEVCAEAIKVLKAVADLEKITLNLSEAPVGGTAYDNTDTPLPDETLKIAREADAVLLGAVGGPKWESLDYSVRPERALLGLRKELGLFANLRPAIIFDELADASSLKKDVISGVNIMVVRELTGGIYFGSPRGTETVDGKRVGKNTLVYDEDEIKRIAKVGFDIALKRNKKLCSVDKANVLESTELWRQVVIEEHANYSNVELSHMYVDNAAMQLIRNPRQFDVIVTGNMFGDILSDAAAMLTGSIGMLPSASLNKDGKGMYEPVHGSAPDIAGKNIANPLATILSVAMMFAYSFDLKSASDRIEAAVKKVLSQGYRTADIFEEGTTNVECDEMGGLVIQELKMNNT